jgi:hypothetical protein
MSQPSFTLLQATRFGQPVIIVFDAALDENHDRAQYPWLLTVQLPMRHPNASGLCDQAESGRLDDLEDRLLASVDVPEYRAVGHVTGNGKREVLLYVSDPRAVSEKLRAILTTLGENSAEIEETRDSDWDYYHQFRPRRN